MSRFVKLKRLKDKVNRLVHERLDENAIVNQLRTDEQFSDANPGEIQAFYNRLVDKFDYEASDKREIAEHEQEIAWYKQEIAWYKRQITECQQILGQQTAKYQQKIARYELGLAKEQELRTEIEIMFKYRQNASKLLICAGFLDNWAVFKYFWQGRFLMTVEDRYAPGDVHTIKIQDLLQGTAKSFTIRKVGILYDIYTLKFSFVLLRQFNDSNRVTRLCLAKFDFERKSLKIVRSSEYNGDCQVLISASDASKFLVQKGKDVYECKLVADKIFERRFLKTNFKIRCFSYFDEQLCSLQFEISRRNLFGKQQLTQVKMCIRDLKQKKHSIQELDSTPENVFCFNPNFSNSFAWIRDTVFLTVKFSLTGKFGIIFTNPQVRNWKTVEFATNLQINHIQSFIDGTLIVCSEAEERRKRRVYKLQMRKPDFLRNMAWNAIVRLFKQAKIKYPHKEARQYLPLNSEIQPFIFIED